MKLRAVGDTSFGILSPAKLKADRGLIKCGDGGLDNGGAGDPDRDAGCDGGEYTTSCPSQTS